MAYNLGVWSEREGDDWEACVISSYLEGLVYGGVTNFPLGVYTQEEREKLERVPDEPQDYNTTDVVAQARYGVHLRKLSTGTLADAVTRVGVGLVLAGYGSLNIATNAPIHSIFYLPMNSGSGLVFDPLAANQSAGVLTIAAKVLAWAKGAGPNDAREVKKGEFEVAYDVTYRTYPSVRTWTTKAGSLTGRRLDPAPLTVTGIFAAGSPAHSTAEVTVSPTPPGWPAGPYQKVVDGKFAGYFVANSEITLGPEPAPADPKLYSQKELDKAIADATAPLKAQIIALNGLIDNHVQAATKPENDLSKAAGIVSKP